MRLLPTTLPAALAAAIAVGAHAPAFAAAPPDMTVVEFFHTPTGHYFMTGSADDQRILTSAPANQSFLPTGRNFAAWSDGNKSRPANAVAVQRFFNPATASHVFTANPADIALLRNLPLSSNPKGFSDEGVAFFALAATAGRCEAGTRAVFRGFNNRADGNHRFSNELELHAATVKTGFSDDGVAFCSTAVGSDVAAEKRAGTPRPTGEDVTVSGNVSNYVSLSSFSIGTQTVDASQARFEGGTSAALTNGVAASAEGVLLNGTLKATEIRLSLGNTPAVGVDELHGFVTALGSTGSVFVNGTAVDISRATIIGGTAAQIIVGSELEVHGAFVDGVFVANTVQIEDTPASSSPPAATGSSEIDGTISQFSSVANFTIANQRIDASNAVFEDGVAADLAVGIRAEVHGRVASGVLIADRVEIKRVRTSASGNSGSSGNGNGSGNGNASAAAFEATGVVSNFVTLASFVVSGATIDGSAATFKNGTVADLRNGVLVEVKGTLSNGVVRAASIEIRSSTSGNGDTSSRAFEDTGAITDFASVASFRINGILVDASTATFVDGVASGLRNGVVVEVTGTLANGVVRASRVEFKSTTVTPPPNPTNPPDGTEFEATSAVSSYVSIASFVVGGTAIDATSASFERGAASDLRNGVVVQVRGVYRAGKVIANRVRFER